MKTIVAVIKPIKLEPVRDALAAIGLRGLTVSRVEGCGHGRPEIHRGSEYTGDLLERLKVELVLPDSRVEEAVRAIQTAAHTGHAGDGIIAVYPTTEIIRISTGEKGEPAL